MSEEKMKNCKYCHSEIPAKAKICPNCRKKQKGIMKWIIIGGVLVLIRGGGKAAGSSKDKNPKKVGSTGASTSSDNTSGDTKETHNEFAVGDIVETDDFRITYISAEDYVSDNEFMQPKEGNKFIKATFEFENISKDDQTVSSMVDFNCYADGYDMESRYFDDGDLSATLSSGKKTQGSVYYEVPVNAQEITIEYKTNYFTQDKIIFDVLKPQ